MASNEAEDNTKYAQSEQIQEPNGKVYSVAYETELNPKSYPVESSERYLHFQEANVNLLTAMESDTGFAEGMKELGIELERTPTGKTPIKPPAGWTWHHDAYRPGVMQLVPTVQHNPALSSARIFQGILHPGPGGAGGFAIWGKIP